MDIQRERTTHSPRPFTEFSPSNGGFPVVRPRDLPYDAYGKLRIGKIKSVRKLLEIVFIKNFIKLQFP